MLDHHWNSYEELYKHCGNKGICPVCNVVDKSVDGMLCARHLPGWERIESDSDERDWYVNYVNGAIDFERGMCYRSLRAWVS